MLRQGETAPVDAPLENTVLHDDAQVTGNFMDRFVVRRYVTILDRLLEEGLRQRNDHGIVSGIGKDLIAAARRNAAADRRWHGRLRFAVHDGTAGWCESGDPNLQQAQSNL